MRHDKIDPGCLDQSSLFGRIRFHGGLRSPERSVSKQIAYIVYIHPVLVDKKALEQTLDDYETFTENQHDCVQPGSGAMEDGQERELGQECECEEKEIHNKRDYGQG
jgi:hypothetical protein